MTYDHVVIEPHADDGFLSLGGHMKEWVRDGYKVLLVTVYGSEKRMNESAAYAEKIGADHHAVGIPESGSMEVLRPEARLRDDRPEIVKLSPLLNNSEIYIPVGLQHVEHKEVRRYFSKGRDPFYYLEIPYYVKPSNQSEVGEEIDGMKVDSVFRPHASKWSAYELFKSQAKFFHFNPVRDFYNVPEIVLWTP